MLKPKESCMLILLFGTKAVILDRPGYPELIAGDLHYALRLSATSPNFDLFKHPNLCRETKKSSA
jgi:hypothetical protein